MKKKAEIPPGAEYDRSREVGDWFLEQGKARKREMSQARWHSRLSPRRVAPSVLAVLVIASVGATADKVFIEDDAPVRPPDIPTRLGRVPGDRHLAIARGADPVERGYPWGIRVLRDKVGNTCAVVGRVKGDRLGVLAGGKFAELPAAVKGRCLNLEREHLLLGVRNYGLTNRTLLYGIADRTILRLDLHKAGGSRSVPIAADGTYIVALRGDHALNQSTLRVERVGGATEHRLGPP